MPERPHDKAHPHPSKRESVATARVDAALPAYAELRVTTNFSFLRGASHPEEYVERAAALGHRAVAIADLHTLAGVVRMHVAGKQAGMPVVIGARVKPTGLGGGSSEFDPVGEHGAGSLLLFPSSRGAYGRLCRLLTLGKRRAPKGQCFLTLHDVIEHQEGMLAVVVPPDGPAAMDGRFVETLAGLRRVFDDDRLSLAASCDGGADDAGRLALLARLATHAGVPMVATNDAHYHDPARRRLQDVLVCIREGVTLDRAGPRLFPNDRRGLLAPLEVAGLFAAYPSALARSVEVAERALGFGLDQIRYEYPEEVCPAGMEAMEWLRALVLEGVRERHGAGEERGSGVACFPPWGSMSSSLPSRSPAPSLPPCLAAPLPRSFPASLPPALLSRLEHELCLIEELGYAKYFLTVHDIVRFARSRGILCQGRGAAANSAVCYYLGITSVDPARIDLLFERFVSRERNEPPDIDIDFEHERREEVIQYIYAKYGRDRAALTAEVITYRGRSAVREVGKALGLSLDLVDRMAKQLDWWDKGVVNRGLLSRMGVDPDDPTIALTMELSGRLLGFPRHLSQHVGGFVITREPLEEIVPIENAAMPDRTIIEWDKDDLDAMGMLKVDCLGLGMLSAVAKALRLVNSWGTRPNRWSSGRVVEWSSEKDGGDAHGERGQKFSRSDRVAEGAFDRLGDLRGDTLHAERGGVRPDVADAPGGVLHLAEHRRGIRTAHAAQVHSWPADRRRLPLRTDDRVPDRDGPAADHAGPRDPCDAEGRGPAAVLPDRQARSQGPTGDAPPPLLIDHSSTRPLDHSPLSLHSIPPEDPAVYDMLCGADSVGVFQVESRAQMSMLPRLRPRCYYDLVIEVAIVRPGPIVGDMVHPYLRRRNGEEAVEYPSEAVRGVLGKTLGVPIFQEQAMRLAIVAAGFSPGEADRLRRAMAAWKRKGDKLLAFERPFIDGMLANGYTPEFSRRCFEQLKGFSEYGFPESHAASFAHIVYASAWLKRHHPAAFCAALINSQPMGFYAPAQLVRDAGGHGVEVRPVDVNRSGWDCALEERWPSGQAAEWSSEASEALVHARPPHPSTRPLDHSTTSPALRLGMRLVSGLRQEHAESIARAVATRGPFSSIEALWRASGVPVSALRRLASADAFGSMGLSRREALWRLRALRDEPLPLFDGEGAEVSGCQGVEAPLPTEPPMHAVAHDYTTTGLSLKAHPMSFYREELSSAGVSPASCLRDVGNWPHGRRVAVAGLVLVRQRPHTASGIVFMTLEDETGIANLIVRPNIYQRDRRAARHAVAMVAWGRVERHGEVIHVLVSRVRELSRVIGQGPRLAPMSRDFH